MPASSWPALLNRLISRADLSAEETGWAMDQVMAGTATPAQVAAFAVALRVKGETAAEISGLVTAMLTHARRVEVPQRAVDVVGTGGDGADSVNISTMAAIAVAAAGVPVVKHGNRAASSACGAADLLEALGVAVDLPAAGVARCVAEIGIGFCFAPVFHPAMRHAAAPRREIGVPTAFNYLGPLTNPAQPAAALVGCASERMAPVMAQVLADRGTSALVVRGDDGLDEITTTSTTSVWVVEEGQVRRSTVDAATLGVPRATGADLRGGDAAVNSAVTLRLFHGEAGAVRDAVLLNAGAAVAAHAGFSGDLVGDLRAGRDRVAGAVDSGAAAALLARWVQLSTQLKSGS